MLLTTVPAPTSALTQAWAQCWRSWQRQFLVVRGCDLRFFFGVAFGAFRFVFFGAWLLDLSFLAGGEFVGAAAAFPEISAVFSLAAVLFVAAAARDESAGGTFAAVG